MTYLEPNIRVNVDVTNPGQFFACCGLLELADRLWPGAEGWFSANASQFLINCRGTHDHLINTFNAVEIQSSLSPNQLKRLATLLSAAKNNLSDRDVEEKQELQAAWKMEQLFISHPFHLVIDWWRDEKGDRTELKTWAAKQMVSDMATAMKNAIQLYKHETFYSENLFLHSMHDDSLPFNFDSDLCRVGNARDAGFSADTLRLKTSYRPLVELLAFIGLQRFRPRSMSNQNQFIYSAWNTPLPTPVASATASGFIPLINGSLYVFELFHRTKYMKAFLPSQPC